MGLQVRKQGNKKYTVEFTGFSNRTGQEEYFYRIENIDEERLEHFLDRSGIPEGEIQYSIWHLRYLNYPAEFDEYGKLKGVVNQ